MVFLNFAHWRAGCLLFMQCVGQNNAMACLARLATCASWLASPMCDSIDSNACNIGIVKLKSLTMTTLTIRNLDEDIKTRLRVAAAIHGCSMEEARVILRRALVQGAEQKGLGSEIHQLFADRDLPALDILARTEMAWVVDFDA
jgi:plasmid stability protein